MLHRQPLSESTRTGEYHVEPWTYDRNRWGIYHPCGVCVDVCHTKQEADERCADLIRAAREAEKCSGYSGKS